MAETIEGVICISFNGDSVLSGKFGRDTPVISKVKFVKTLRAKHSPLLVRMITPQIE